MLPAMDFSFSNFVTRVLFATLVLVAASYPSLRVNDNGPSRQSTSLLRKRLTAQRKRDTPVAVSEPASMRFNYLSFWKNHIEPLGEQRSRKPSDDVENAVTLPSEGPKNYTWDQCEHTGDCVPDRSCIDFRKVEQDELDECEKGKTSHRECFCVPLQDINSAEGTWRECVGPADCVPEEYCTKVDDVDNAICISDTFMISPDKFPEFNQNSAPSEDQPVSTVNNQSEGGESQPDECVDAKALEHLPSHNLVFQRHATAKVLCDANRSCATPGHMVTYKREAMMMRTYCGLVGCKEDIMAVNSPRYRRGLSIKSKTTGLEYSSFAARYQTKAEEILIRIAVHVGL